jgi:hypothetical protein
VQGQFDGADARRQSALEQRRAELDPVGAGPFGGQRPFDAVDADLERGHAVFSFLFGAFDAV